jgi:hypothetical protein
MTAFLPSTVLLKPAVSEGISRILEIPNGENRRTQSEEDEQVKSQECFQNDDKNNVMVSGKFAGRMRWKHTALLFDVEPKARRTQARNFHRR